MNRWKALKNTPHGKNFQKISKDTKILPIFTFSSQPLNQRLQSPHCDFWLKKIQNILQIPFWQGRAEALLNFSALFSYWSIRKKWNCKILFWGALSKKDCKHVLSKKEQRQNSKVLQLDLVKKVFVRYPGSSLVIFDYRLGGVKKRPNLN